MSDQELRDFAFVLVDGCLENVFRRFPEHAATRARVYRYIAHQLQELAADLMLEDV